jgi:hypothetical protein
MGGLGIELLGVEPQRRGDPDQSFQQVPRALTSPMMASAETSQNEQIKNVPSLPDNPSSVWSVR